MSCVEYEEVEGGCRWTVKVEGREVSGHAFTRERAEKTAEAIAFMEGIKRKLDAVS